MTTERFIVEDNQVIDTKTGLIWMRDARHLGKMTWDEAVEEVKKLGDGWRLPTKDEFQSLLPLPGEHPFELNESSTFFWTSTSSVNGLLYAWYVDFGNGNVYPSSKTGSYYIWPVRGGVK